MSSLSKCAEQASNQWLRKQRGPGWHRPGAQGAEGGEPGTGTRPPAGARYPDPGGPGEQSPASRHEPDVQNVAKSQV